MKKEFVLFLVFNSNFYEPLTVWIDSFLRNGNVDPELYDLVCYCSNEVDVESLQKRITVPFTLITGDSSKYKHQLNMGNYMHREGYILTAALRLDAIDHLKHEYRTGIYFDIDALVCDDVSEMFNHLPDNKKVKAAFDHPMVGFKIKNDLPLVDKNYVNINPRYFNNGVMVLNFDSLDEDMSPLFIKHSGSNMLFEQDFMNYFYKPEDIMILPYNYNCHPSYDVLGMDLKMVERLKSFIPSV